MDESRCDRSFVIYPPPPFFHINFEFPKFLRKLIRSEKIVPRFSQFARNLPPFFSHQFWISKIFEKVNSKWKNRDKIFAIHLKSTPLFSKRIRSEKIAIRSIIRNLSPPPFLTSILNFQNSWESEFEVKKTKIFAIPSIARNLPFFYINFEVNLK